MTETRKPSSFKTVGASSACTVTKAEHDALTKNRDRPLTQDPMSLRKVRNDAWVPTTGDAVFGVDVTTLNEIEGTVEL